MMPRSRHQCHAIGCSSPMPFGTLFCEKHDPAWRALPTSLVIRLVELHQRFYRVGPGMQLVRNVTNDRVVDAEVEASYHAALSAVVLELARIEGKPLPAMVRS